MALVPYLSAEDLADEHQFLLRRPINLFRALANSPEGLRHYSALGDWIRHGCELDPRLRELAILQVGYTSGSRYEFSHHVKIGRDFGVRDSDIAALVDASSGRPHGLGELDSAVLSAAREITATQKLADGTRGTLRAHLGDRALVDLVLVISFYNAVIRVLGVLDIDVEPEYRPFLDEFPVPEREAAGPC